MIEFLSNLPLKNINIAANNIINLFELLNWFFFVRVSMLLRAGSNTNPAKFGRSGWSPEVVASPQCSRSMRDDHWRTFCKFLVRVLLIWKNCCCFLDAAYQSHTREPKRQNHCASYLCQYHIWRYSSQGNSCISLWFLYLHYYPFLDHVEFCAGRPGWLR